MEEQKTTKKTPAIITIAVIVIAIILIFIFKSESIIDKFGPGGPTTEPTDTITPPESATTTTAKPIIDEWTGVPPNQMPSAKIKPGEETLEIIYTDAGFAPQTLTTKQGRVVTFKNLSSSKLWPASANHPTHEVYPTTGGCLGSTFDSCRSLASNDTWSFRFDIPGTWGYHDHLNPTKTGTIIVEK
ncbi:MAG: hypothetical protein QMD50_03590 [Patescibacteria group bacterium]|nr:hypothetical protein [Patescibacteria group bacterium]